MISVETLFLFTPIAILLALTPGAGMLFALGQGVKSGPLAGLAVGLGAATGTIAHTIVAAAGLAAILEAYPLSFEVIRWMGVAYLLYLGIKALLSSAAVSGPQGTALASPFQTYMQSIAVNLLNPKVAIFILAFVPQFIDPNSGSVFWQFLVLGSILSVVGGLVDGTIGATAGKLGSALRARPAVGQLLSKLTGVIFLSLAAKLAFEKR